MNPVMQGICAAAYAAFWVVVGALIGRLFSGEWPSYVECIATAALVIASSEAVLRLQRECSR